MTRGAGVRAVSRRAFARKSAAGWSVGVLECWSVGVLECWSVGVLECWSVGVLECWGVGALECWTVINPRALGGGCCKGSVPLCGFERWNLRPNGECVNERHFENSDRCNLLTHVHTRL